MTESFYLKKKKYSKMLKDFLRLNTKNKPTGLILIKNTEYIDFLLDGLEVLSCDFVIKTEEELKRLRKKKNIFYTKEIKKDLLMGFDFMVVDNETENLIELFSAGIVPIIPENNHLAGILKEFDPISSEGNSYLYKDKNKWSLYHAIVRYLENYRFPYDNMNLVKNVIGLG